MNEEKGKINYMNTTVEPIRDLKLIKDIYEYLKVRNYRDYIIFFFGVNTGLRISDILKLKTYDVKDTAYIYLREKKTKKERKIPLFPYVKNELETYMVKYNVQGFLFKGRYRDTNLCRERFWQIMKQVEREFDLRKLGTHTLRKTFGYHFYKQTNDIVTLMAIFNHREAVTTIRYIGMSQDRINKRMKDFRL